MPVIRDDAAQANGLKPPLADAASRRKAVGCGQLSNAFIHAAQTQKQNSRLSIIDDRTAVIPPRAECRGRLRSFRPDHWERHAVAIVRRHAKRERC